jgi:hypothetical protein
MNDRFLIDYANPDAGIGHSMGFINRAIKVSARNKLQFAYSEDQLLKSHEKSWVWKLKQAARLLRGRKRYETHNIGNDLNHMLGLKEILPSRDEIMARVKRGELKIVDLPFPELPIPSNEQIDEIAYTQVDRFIQTHTELNIVFRLNNKNSGDYEYASTRNWFVNVYSKAREPHPIPLSFNPNELNIAVHIRRGDLLPGRQFSDLSSRMLPDAWYLEILNVVAQSTNRKLAIHIFSEGRDGQYHSESGAIFSWKACFQDTPYKVYEHIDSEFKSTFHHLLNADILIGSKSGMSHLAGMLGKHIKIMPKMWHSYRGATQLLEVSDQQTELHQDEIEQHLKQYL